MPKSKKSVEGDRRLQTCDTAAIANASSGAQDMTNGETAIQRIESQFPEIRDELHDETWEGLLHLQISVFARLTQRAIDDGDRARFKKACDLFADLFTQADPELVNALNVSYLEHLEFNDDGTQRRWAYDAMPDVMRKAHDSMDEYNKHTHGNS